MSGCSTLGNAKFPYLVNKLATKSLHYKGVFCPLSFFKSVFYF